MKIGCIIQARYGSTRLPGKVLLPLPMGDRTSVLEQVVKRVKAVDSIDEVIVATSDLQADDKIIEECNKIGVKYYRGPEKNVLKRFYDAAKENNLDVIIRITSDCPCLDYEVIEQVIQLYLKGDNDYASNSIVRSYPHGMDTEVFSFKVLEDAYNNASDDFEKEHVTPYIYKVHKDKYNIAVLKNINDYSDIRITLDTYDDYLAIAAVYDYLGEDFLLTDIIKIYDEKPWLYKINSNIIQKKIFDSIEDEVKEAIDILDKQDLNESVNILKEYLDKK